MSSPASSLQPGPWSSRGGMESHLNLVILEDGSSPAGRCCPVGKWEAADPGPEGFAVRVAFSCHRDETVLSSDLIFCRWLCEDCPGQSQSIPCDPGNVSVIYLAHPYVMPQLIFNAETKTCVLEKVNPSNSALPTCCCSLLEFGLSCYFETADWTPASGRPSTLATL